MNDLTLLNTLKVLSVFVAFSVLVLASKSMDDG